MELKASIFIGTVKLKGSISENWINADIRNFVTLEEDQSLQAREHWVKSDDVTNVHKP